MQPTKLAIVGCGAITESGHLPAALQSPLIDVAALVDVRLDNARGLSRRFGLTCAVADTLESVINLVEGVVIATPNHTHAAIAEVALTRGIATLIEKPLTTQYADAMRLCDLADQMKTFISVGYRSRFWPSVPLLKHLLDTSYLGRIQSFDYTFGTQSTWAAVSGFGIDRAMAGGGILIDAHVLDKVIFWFGEPTDFAFWDDSHGGVEATCKATARFEAPEGAFTGSILLSRSMDLEKRLVIDTDRFVCELGESPRAQVTLREKARPDLVLEVRSRDLGQDGRSDFRLQLEEFVDNIRRPGKITIDGRFAARSVKLTEAMYQRRQQLPEPWMIPSAAMERAAV